MKKILFVVLLAFLIVMTLMAGGAKEARAKDENVINIAYFGTISGGMSEVGIMGRDAAILAVEHINAEGGIKALGGAKINLIVADTTSDPSRGVAVAQRILDNYEISAIVQAGVSQMALAEMPVAEKAGVPMVSGAISDKLTQAGYKYFFEPCPKGGAFGAMQVEFLKYMVDNYGVTLDKVGIIYENTAYGQSTALGIKKLCKEYGFTVVIEESYPANFTDAAPMVTKIKEAGAEIIFPVSYTNDAALIMSSMKTLKYKPIVIAVGAGFIWPEFAKALGDLVEGVFSVGSWSWDTINITRDPNNLKVTEAWKEKYGTFMPEIAGEIYADVYIVKEAIEIAGTKDPKDIRNALANIKITSGRATMWQPGIVEFDETGASKHVVPTIIQWQGGVVKTVYPVELTDNKINW